MAVKWRVAVIGAALLQIASNEASACGPEIEIRFFESSGGDIFTITNKSQEPWSLVELEIRLAGSRGYLVFDTADGGPGFNMHQPFEPVDNAVGLVEAPVVGDGDEQLRLRFREFAPGRSFIFVIDVDDRLEISDFGQAVISGAEIEGAEARGAFRKPGGGKSNAKGRFGDDGRAVLRGGLCA